MDSIESLKIQLNAERVTISMLEKNIDRYKRDVNTREIELMDLKEQCRNLEQLLDNQTKEIDTLTSFYEANPFSVVRIDQTGRVYYFNTIYNELFNRWKTKLGGKINNDFLKTIQPFPETGNKQVEATFFNRHFNLHISVIPNSEIYNIYCIEVTQQIKAEREKLASEKRYRDIIENMQLGLVELDNNGIIISVNGKFRQMTSFDKSELIGVNYQSILKNEIASLSNNDDGGVYEVEILDKQQNSRFCLVSETPVYDENRHTTGLVRMHMDISESKKIEIELKQAKEKAEQSSQVKEQFLANMSHEIRTPMNAIVGMAQLLSKSKLEFEQKQYLEAIIQSSDNLLIIINDILDLSKINASNFELCPMTFDFHHWISDLAKTSLFQCKDKDINFNLLFDNSIAQYIHSDKVRLNQILINLLGNAIKFTDEGEISLEVLLKEENQDTCQVSFTVRDSGIGIEQKNIELIFDIFSQEDASTSKRFGGTGLGLPICKQLISCFGGELLVKSQKGVGSSFSFAISLSKGNSNDMEQKVVFDFSPDVLEGVFILLAEDNEYNQLLAKNVLEDYSATVKIADTGNEVIEHLKDNINYQLILMDLQMPEMSGLEATEIIRQQLKLDIPIIALTANALSGDRKRFVDMGMNDYLSKPFEAQDLIAKITKLLNIDTSDKHIPLKEVTMTTQENDDLYSLHKLDELTNNNREFMKHLIRKFIDSTPEILESLKSSAEINDDKAISAHSHKLRASYNSFCIDVLKDPLYELDEHIRDLTKHQRNKLVAKVIDISEEIMQKLEEELEKP